MELNQFTETLAKQQNSWYSRGSAARRELLLVWFGVQRDSPSARPGDSLGLGALHQHRIATDPESSSAMGHCSMGQVWEKTGQCSTKQNSCWPIQWASALWYQRIKWELGEIKQLTLDQNANLQQSQAENSNSRTPSPARPPCSTPLDPNNCSWVSCSSNTKLPFQFSVRKVFQELCNLWHGI